MSAPRRLDALIVGGVDFGESDRVVHTLTAEGRLSVFAPAARKSRRRFGGALEPLTTVTLELGRQRRDAGLVTITGAEIQRARLGLTRDLERLALATYWAELTFRLAPEGVETDLRAILEDALDALPAAPAGARARRRYELRMVVELGYAPELRGCAMCGVPARFLDFERGGLVCSKHRDGAREIGPKTAAWLEAALGADELAPCGPLTEDEAERAARAAGPSLDRALRAWLDRPLASRSWLESLGL